MKKKNMISFVCSLSIFSQVEASLPAQTNIVRAYSTKGRLNKQSYKGRFCDRITSWYDFFNPNLPTLAQPPVPKFSEKEIKECIKNDNLSLLSDTMKKEGFNHSNDLNELERLNTVLSNVLLKQQQEDLSKESFFSRSKKTDTDNTRNE